MIVIAVGLHQPGNAYYGGAMHSQQLQRYNMRSNQPHLRHQSIGLPAPSFGHNPQLPANRMKMETVCIFFRSRHISNANTLSWPSFAFVFNVNCLMTFSPTEQCKYFAVRGRICWDDRRCRFWPCNTRSPKEQCIQSVFFLFNVDDASE